VTAQSRVYRINPWNMAVLPGVWLVVIVMLLGLIVPSATPDEREAGLFTVLIVTLIMATVFYFAVWRCRLELNEAGIVQYQFGYSIRSSWANVERLSLRPHSQGLYLTEPGTDSRSLRVSVRFVQVLSATTGLGGLDGDADAFAQGRFITLVPFTSHLKNGALRRDLERWAPHLFRVDPNENP
jgi:hypothetical protein